MANHGQQKNSSSNNKLDKHKEKRLLKKRAAFNLDTKKGDAYNKCIYEHTFDY